MIRHTTLLRVLLLAAASMIAIDARLLGQSEPRLGVTLSGGGALEEGWLTPGDDPEDGDFPDPGGDDGDLVSGYQRLTLEFDPIVAAPSSRTPAAQDAAPYSAWSLLVSFWDALRGPIVYAEQSQPSLTAMIVSLGTSQGEAFRLSIVNHGRRAIKLAGDGLVVQPLKAEAMKALQRQMAKFTRGITNVKINGYCLDEGLLPPVAGMAFRVAPASVQKQIGSMKHVLRAGRMLATSGGLHPDSSPGLYTDFIKQWAIWTKRERWDQVKFAAKFVEHTKKRLESDGRKWTPDVDRALKGATPGRWADIQAVLALADGK